MSKNNRLPRINNSGQHRLPDNVRLVTDNDIRPPFDPKFYEDEIQEFADKHPEWIFFVLEKGGHE